MSELAAITTTRRVFPRALRRSEGGILRTVGIGAGLLFFTLWTLLPVVWLIETSLKPDIDIYTHPGLAPIHLGLTHYFDVLANTSFMTYARNSATVAVLTTAGALFVGVSGGYALARLRFRGRSVIANIAIVTYLVPGALLFIPLFQVAYELHLTNRAVGLVPIYLTFAAPFCTWLALSYFQTIPRELEDAAIVDGASRLKTLLHVILPLSLPALAVIALFAFIESWNEFLLAFVLVSSDDQKTIPIGLAQYVVGDLLKWGDLTAASVLASIPPVVVFLLAQRWLVTGLAAGAVKG